MISASSRLRRPPKKKPSLINLDQLSAHGVAFRSASNPSALLDMFTLAIINGVPMHQWNCLCLSIEMIYHSMSLIGFQAINHGMTDSLLDQLRQATKKFFALPMGEKQKYSRSLEDYQGYGNDTVLAENQTLDWADRLYLVVSPEDQQKLQLWPENPENFR